MNYCKTCGLRAQENKCALTGRTIDPATDYCSSHIGKVQTCELCGSMLLPSGSIIEIDNNQTMHLICGRCNQALSTCAGCANVQTCDFETNPSTEPKIITQQFRQGNSIIQTQIKNPSRIEITCKQNCSCFSPENGCLREFNSQCEKYRSIWEVK